MKQQNLNKLSNKPYVGTKDYYGSNLDLLFYIFNKWRKLAQSYNYQEYINPIVEYAILYKAKSGDDLGNKELYDFIDKGGREIAIRPEATPSVTRLVSQFYNTTLKPIRMFSIQNFMRYQKPQKGRYREFWQFNIDMFGDDSVTSDFEMLKIAIQSILIFNPPQNSFKVYVNNRKIMDVILENILQEEYNLKIKVQKIIDKFTKLTQQEFIQELKKIGLTSQQIKDLGIILKSNLQEISKLIPSIKENSEFVRINKVFEMLDAFGLSKYYKFNPAIVRGIDYYDGIVFEAFDLNPENNRAMFGGGRYNGLGHLFGIKNMPAIGFAPGNATMELFLKNWNIIPSNIKPTISFYLPQIEKNKTLKYYKLADKLKQILKDFWQKKNKNLDIDNKTIAIEVSNKPKGVSQALKYALAKRFDYLIIYGATEMQKNIIIIKDLAKKKQIEISLK